MWVVQRGKEGGLLFSEGRMEERGERTREREKECRREGRRGRRQLALGHTSVLQMCPLPLLESGKKKLFKKGKIGAKQIFIVWDLGCITIQIIVSLN